ncbi:MAG: Tic22 family protein [Gloeomargarita sp. GMQP_bins_69]
MKGLIRGGLALGLLLGPVMGLPLQVSPVLAQGMPTKQIAEQLQTVPVFTLIDGSGKQILTATVKEGNKEKVVTFFFFNPQDAQNALKQVQSQNPDAVKGARVQVVGLDKAYELAKAAQKDEKLEVSFQPDKAQQEAALKILQAEGQKLDRFPGIPLFFITGGPQQGQLTIQVQDQKGNKEEVAPMFFSRQDVEGFLAELRKRDPKIAESAKIRVSSLDQLVALMEQKNDPQLRQIYFVPASSAIRFVQQQQGNRPPQPPAAPAPQPQSPQ